MKNDEKQVKNDEKQVWNCENEWKWVKVSKGVSKDRKTSLKKVDNVTTDNKQRENTWKLMKIDEKQVWNCGNE